MSKRIVEQVRPLFPTPLGAQHGPFLLALCRALGPEYGLYRKAGGTVIELPDGETVSQDIVVNRDGRAWDVLVHAEGDAEPTWEAKEPNQDPRKFYAVSAADEPDEDEPPPVPVPKPPKPPATTDRLIAALRDALNENAQQVREMFLILEAQNERIFKNLTEQLAGRGTGDDPTYRGTFKGAGRYLGELELKRDSPKGKP